MQHSEKDRRKEFIQLLAAEEKSPAPCKHVAEGCGGCLLQEFEYQKQVSAKEAYLTSLYGKTVRVVPCPDPLGYRNRMDFVTAFGKKGLRKRGKYAQVVDVQECLLLPRHAQEAYLTARDALSPLEDYNYLRHQGFLRYLTIRTSRTTRDTLLILTTTTPKDQEEHARVQALLEELFASSRVTGIVWTVNDSVADVSVGEEYWHAGQDWIIDEIAGFQFRVTPKTFFQANTFLAGELFRNAARFATGNTLDLYCGVGAISLIVSQSVAVERVVGVDVVRESISAAHDNATLNGIPVDKCVFVCADAANYLKISDERFETVICDPSRPGLGKEACALLLEKSPSTVIYISCNPLSHKDDLAILSKKYEIVHLEGYDLFPQTPHVEVLSVLKRRDLGTFE